MGVRLGEGWASGCEGWARGGRVGVRVGRGVGEWV